MPRRYLNRSIKADAPDVETRERYLLDLPGRELYRSPDRLPRITSPALFGNHLPLDLEIGCGTGEYLCALAERDPDANYLGVELHLKSLHKAVGLAASAGLANALFVRANFTLMYPLLAPGALRAASLHFPDPNVEPRFRKRRIFSAGFLDAMHRSLAPGGRLSVMTDHAGLFFDMLEIAERDARWERTHAERYLVGFEPPVKSRYQRIWEGHGLSTLRFELTPKGGPPSAP